MSHPPGTMRTWRSPSSSPATSSLAAVAAGVVIGALVGAAARPPVPVAEVPGPPVSAEEIARRIADEAPLRGRGRARPTIRGHGGARFHELKPRHRSRPERASQRPGARRQEVADRPAARGDARRAGEGRRPRARRSRPSAPPSSASSAASSSSSGPQVQDLTETTQSLREALSSTKARGQWGERMAEDVLRLAGFVEGVNYRKQHAIAGGHPRLHVPAARRPVVCTWT